MYLFFDCSKSIGCWQRVGLWQVIQKVWFPTLSCTELIFTILQEPDTSQQQRFEDILWSIWKHRNNKVWNNVLETIQKIVDRAKFF